MVSAFSAEGEVLGRKSVKGLRQVKVWNNFLGEWTGESIREE